jgi:hypothetical protein
MTKKALQLLDALKHGEILHVPALPFKRKGYYADMALVTNKGNTRLIAEGADLPNGEEAFFLNLNEYDADRYWTDKEGVSAWPPRPNEVQNWTAVDLAFEIKESGLGAILGSRRRVTFYRSRSSANIGVRGVLQSAAALMLGAGDEQLLIHATPVFPCSLEVVTGLSRMRSLLLDLEEFCLTNQ